MTYIYTKWFKYCISIDINLIIIEKVLLLTCIIKDANIS